MSTEFERFLTAGPDVVSENDRLREEAARKAAAEEQAKKDRQKSVSDQWNRARGSLEGVIARTNKAFEKVGVALSLQEQESYSSISETKIVLYRYSNNTGNYVHLKITTIGNIVVLFRSARTQKSESKQDYTRSVELADSEYFANIITEFTNPLLHEL